MSINNTIYDTDAHLWWEDDSYLQLLRTSLNPARFSYFMDVLSRLGVDPRNRRALDVGCGGGILAEEFSRAGCRVSGMDPSTRSLSAARAHAVHSGLKIDWGVAPGEHLPFADSTFDIVYCCDVLEHVDDLGKVLSESARVLKPGGIYFFDTINRTAMSWLSVIFAAQEFPLTRIFPPGTHAWFKFITPTGLAYALESQGISLAEFRGLAPGIHPLHNAWMLFQRKTGRLTYSDYGRKSKMVVTDNLSINYAGYGIRRPGKAQKKD